MLRALVWKEWREQRPVVYAGAVLAASLPLILAAGLPLLGPRREIIDLVGVLPIALGVSVWPVLAAAAGATTISTEAVGRTFGFLLSRPVTRSRLWLIKMAVALMSLLAVAAISLLLTQLCTYWLSQGRMDMSLAVILRRTALGPFDFLVIASASLLLFACATLFSTLISRPLVAAAAGAVLTLVLLAGILLLWGVLALPARLEPQWLAAELAMTGAILLVVSYAIFSRPELWRRGSGRRASGVAVAGVLFLGLVCIGAIPTARAMGRSEIGGLVIAGDSIAVSSAGVAFETPVPAGQSGEVWLVRADGSGTLPITGRFATKPIMGPRIQDVFYFSRRGLWGSAMDSYDLRAARADGSGGRLIASGLPGAGKLHFSPYGRRALLALDDTLFLIELDGRGVAKYDIGVPELAGATMVGWIDSLADEVLFVRTESVAGATSEPADRTSEPTDRTSGPTGRRAEPTRQMTLLAFGLTDGETRILYSGEVALDRYSQPSSPSSGWRYFPLPVAVDESDVGTMRIDLFDLELGGTSTLGQGTCFSGSFDRGDLLTYILCSESDGRALATVATTFIDRGEERSISDLELGGGSLTLVDAWVTDWYDFKAWVLLRQELPPSGASEGETVAVVLGPDGHRLSMTPGWIPIGLSGSSRVLLVDDLEQIRTIASGDLQTGRLQVIFP
jgi:hypothetical protein